MTLAKGPTTMRRLLDSALDAWLAIKRFWHAYLGDSDLRFDTEPGALEVTLVHDGRRKTVCITTERLDAAVRYMDAQPRGAPVVFRQGEAWVIVPDFFARRVRDHLADARDALARSRVGVAGAESAPAAPVVNVRASAPRAGAKATN